MISNSYLCELRSISYLSSKHSTFWISPCKVRMCGSFPVAWYRSLVTASKGSRSITTNPPSLNITTPSK